MELENNVVICTVCGRIVEDEAYETVQGETICHSCGEDGAYFRCECCDELFLESELQYINDESLCIECFSMNYSPCACCGEYVHDEDLHTTIDGESVCRYCRDEFYYRCSECGELVHQEDVYWDDENEVPYCRECYNEVEPNLIKSYRYKPEPIFHDVKPYNYHTMYMGIELEIDKGGESSRNAKQILNTVNTDEENHAYAKHDGSLDDGFEIVSHPATLEYHINNIEWKKLMEKALALGYRSHDTETCGLHIHISRGSLGSNYFREEETIAKILYFMEKNWNEILRFTRRTEYSLQRWASRYGIYKNLENTYKRAKGDYNRYRCLNLQNESTIEFRIFRGTLNYNTFIATLQFVKFVCDFCIASSMEEIEDIDWNKFISKLDGDQNAELVEYLKIRNLYF